MTTTPPDAPIGPPPPDPTGDHGPRVDRDQVRDLGRLRRSRSDRKVAGVAGGLGRHLDIDPLILRVAFVVLVFFGGAGLIVYAACWLLVPEDGSDRAAIHLDERSRTFVLIGAGAIAALAMIGDSWGGGWFPWPVAVVALIALWLLTRNNPPSAARRRWRRPGHAVRRELPRELHRELRADAPAQQPYAAAARRTSRPTRRSRPCTSRRHRATAEPAQARPDPVLVHARADRAQRGRARHRRPGRRRHRRTRRTPRSLSGSAA